MPLSNITVMICDDSILVRKKMKDYISSLGVGAIYEASDGEEAIAKYKECNPAVVFMDIVMPKKTGTEALKEIIQYDPSAKVIMVSSVGTQSHLKEALCFGALDFLQKPIVFEQVSQILKNIAKDVK